MNIRSTSNDSASSITIIHLFAAYWRSIKCVWRINRHARLERSICYLLRSLMRPCRSALWMLSLEQGFSPKQRSLRPRLILKPHRQFISRQYSFSQRVDAFLMHHSLLAEFFSTTNRDILLAGKKLEICSCFGKDGHRYQLVLHQVDRFDREGELILSLSGTADAQMISCAVFSFNHSDGHNRLDIGCLQGAADPLARQRIKLATKALHGIRPKNLLIDCLYFLAQHLDISHLYAIDNRNRIFCNSKVHADYDAFWRELGGNPHPHGFFALPETPRHHAIAEVSSHHRAEYRRRATLRQNLQETINTNLNRSHSTNLSNEQVPRRTAAQFLASLTSDTPYFDNQIMSNCQSNPTT